MMKSAIPFTLVISLIGSAFPAAAQEDTSTTGPIARSITRAAARFAAVPSADPNWERVRKVLPGTAIILAVTGSQPKSLYFVRADESDLFVTVTKQGDVVETVARDDVVEIDGPVRTRGSKHGAVIGTVVGLAAAVLIGYSQLFCGETNSCSPGAKFAPLLPFGGGFLGWYASSHDGEIGVIYRTP